MNKLWLVTKSATAAFFLVSLGTSYAQAEILATVEGDFSDEAFADSATYDSAWLVEEQTLVDCETAIAASAALEAGSSDPAIQTDATGRANASELAMPPATETHCLEVADSTTLSETEVSAGSYYADSYTAGSYAPPAALPAYPAAADSLEAAPQWELSAPAAAPLQPEAPAAPPTQPMPPAPVAAAPAPAPTAAEPVLMEDDPEFRAWLERDSEAARNVAALKQERTIRGDRSYGDLIVGKGIPEPAAAKPAAPSPAPAASAPEVSADSLATRVAEEASATSITPLLAQLEADLQRIRQQATQAPAPLALPPLNLSSFGLESQRPTFALSSQPGMGAALPSDWFDPLAGEGFSNPLAFRPPDLSFLKTDAFKRDRHGLRLALFDRTSENEAIATEFLAGNPLFDGTLNAVLADTIASQRQPGAAAAPEAELQWLADSLALLAAPEQTWGAFAGSNALNLLGIEELVAEFAPSTLLPLKPGALLEEPPLLELEFSLPVEPEPDSSPLAVVFEEKALPARSLRNE